MCMLSTMSTVSRYVWWMEQHLPMSRIWTSASRSTAVDQNNETKKRKLKNARIRKLYPQPR